MLKLTYIPLVLLAGLSSSLALQLGVEYTGQKPPIPERAGFNFTGTNVLISVGTSQDIYLAKQADSNYWIRLGLVATSTLGGNREHILSTVETGYYTNTWQWTNESYAMYRVGQQPSVVEYAFYLSSPDGGGLAYVGNGHGYDDQYDITATMDGAAVTLNANDLWVGTNAVLKRYSRFIRSDVNTNVLATNVLSIYFSLGNPFAVQKTTTWTKACSIEQYYTSMFILDKTNEPTNLGGDGFAARLVNKHDNSNACDGRHFLLYMYWGNYAVCQYFSRMNTVAYWNYIGPSPVVTVGAQERTADCKLYHSMVQGPPDVVVAPGDVWDVMTYWDFVRNVNISSLFP